MGNVVDDLVTQVFETVRADRGGAVADYIPELAAVDPDLFGIVVATGDGHLYEVGDTAAAFSIQSISKPFTYALALADRGVEAVAEKIDLEPSGEPFNEISLDPGTERPRNPMINAGAITAASLVAGSDPQNRFARIRSLYSRCAGRQLHLDEAVYTSEARTGHRNRAIGYMLRSFDVVTGDPDEAVDLYFRQCSIDVTCRDLAMMAVTLANNGTHPHTRDRVLDPSLVERVLSVMTTCGMYDSAGEWVTDVGLPAKSGVGGGVLAVLPGQLGIAVYSPRLNRHGNSVRGVRACRELSRILELHFLHVTRAARSAIRARYTVAAVRSRTRRSEAEQNALDTFGDRGRIFELHGDLLFTGAETAVREIERERDDLEAVVVDVRRVDEVSDIARRMFEALAADLVAAGCRTALVDPDGVFGHTVSSLTAEDPQGRVFVDADTATRWCEEVLLNRHCVAERPPDSITLEEHPLLSDLTSEQFERFTDELEPRTAARGEVIARRGGPASGIHLILSGRASTTVTGEDGTVHRITTLGAGMSFGEMPTLLGSTYLNDVRADTTVTMAVLSPAGFARLTAIAPEVKSAILERLAAVAYGQLEMLLSTFEQRGRI
ncbi:glutaminase A [Rhodococcus sp. SGAir0479]|uniref:glutaminase A n=1 Tax=Rhodococcus sp. SGAir0479 TaxID=2567884 RepID=UPI0010CCCD42|nr:glutaminase A [Rhodococcus sp. SGAir0479]QCQ90843.1 glutaminase A [Rhodococcus sp. SGAir0479]